LTQYSDEVKIENSVATIKLVIKDATTINLLSLLEDSQRPRFIERAIAVGAQFLQAQMLPSTDVVKRINTLQDKMNQK
jgi:hypothetical protein